MSSTKSKAHSSNRKKRRPHALSYGRPTSSSRHVSSTTPNPNQPPSLASHHTRRLIRTHHTLHKQLAHAERTDNTTAASALRAEIAAHGGLAAYQAASAAAAHPTRGGDTSGKLVAFLRSYTSSSAPAPQKQEPLAMLDVGAVTTDTAVARSGLFGARGAHITRIDLRARAPGIAQQDFMARPLPRAAGDGDDARFDVVALSLVLNYVTDAAARGEMLRRVCAFLRPPAAYEPGDGARVGAQRTPLPLPALFLVLPAPCVQNSRYLDQRHLETLTAALGFSLAHCAVTAKLAYYLFQWHGGAARDGLDENVAYPKVEVNPGKSRNNFAIVLE